MADSKPPKRRGGNADLFARTGAERGPHRQRVAAHAFVVEPQFTCDSQGMCGEIEEQRIKAVGRIFWPVEPDGIDIRIGLREVHDQGAGIGADLWAGEAPVAVDAPVEPAAVGQQWLVFVARPAELHAITRRDRGLHLEMDLHAALLRSFDESCDERALPPRQLRRCCRLIGQAVIKRSIGDKARSALHPELTSSPKLPVEQPHAPRTGIDRGFTAACTVLDRLHHVRRCRYARDAGCLKAVQDGVRPLCLYPFRQHRDAKNLATFHALSFRECGHRSCSCCFLVEAHDGRP